MWQQVQDTTNQLWGATLTALSVTVQTLSGIVQHLYMILVRQEIIIGALKSIEGVFFLGLAIVAIKLCNSAWHSGKIQKLDKLLLIAALMGVVYVSLGTGWSRLTQGVPYLLNPEYYAIQDGARLIKEVRP